MSTFNLLKPGAKVQHKTLKFNGTVLSCINLHDKEDRLEQGPRYYVATSVDVWSVPHDSLKLVEQGQGLSDYLKNRYAKYLIAGHEISEFGPNTHAKEDPATQGTPSSKTKYSGAIK